MHVSECLFLLKVSDNSVFRDFVCYLQSGPPLKFVLFVKLSKVQNQYKRPSFCLSDMTH